MNDVIVKDNKTIEDMIYEIRGMQVMLDSDLAKLYKCSNGTKDINKAVKRNIERFPKEFYFQLTNEEKNNLWFQIGTANKMTRSNPYVFTEQGIAMLAGVLHTDKAIQTSIDIINAFVLMKKYISSGLLEQKYYNDMTIRHDSEIKMLQESFDKLEENKEINEIYFNGKIYDAYSKVLDIFSNAKKELIIIDRYADKTILDMIKKLNCKIILITSRNSKLTDLDIKKYNSSYHNLIIYYDDTYHDRYFILDKEIIYHTGNSVNHIGYRKSSINILNDISVKKSIIEDIDKIIKR